jgi:alkylation response protein AidB-like acyl-CoA dehydrogenase
MSAIVSLPDSKSSSILTSVPQAPSKASEAASHSRSFLGQEREVLEKYFPGLDSELASIPFSVLESKENPGIRLFKERRGPALLIPEEYGGLGASAIDATRVMRAIGARAPSLGIVCTMHSFSVSTLVEWAIFGEEYGQLLLSGLAENSMYVASGFAEGRSGSRPLDMTMRARRAPNGGWLINGRKKPCTLTHSMDFLSCGLIAETEDGVWRRAVGLIPADVSGIERRSFWTSPILAGAESDEVILTDAHVPDDFVFITDQTDALNPVEITGYVWFQLSLTSTYLGIVSALVEKVLESGKGTAEERAQLIVQVENQATALDGIAYALHARENQQRLLCRALSTRYGAQAAIEHLAMRSVELLGGMAFMSNSDITYRMCACRAMSFHPPGRLFALSAIEQYAQGGQLDVS